MGVKSEIMSIHGGYVSVKGMISSWAHYPKVCPTTKKNKEG